MSPLARQAGGKTPAAKRVKALLETMLCDLERVRAALRAGARPQQICGINSLTRRALKPDTVAHGPDGDLLILARWGRMTQLGHLWDELERARSRSPCGKTGEMSVPPESKGAITANVTDASNCRPNAVPSAAQ